MTFIFELDLDKGQDQDHRRRCCRTHNMHLLKQSLNTFYWATVCKTLRPMLSDRCLSCRVLSCLSACLTVTLVYCGQTVEWIKMKLGVHVGLGPGDIVLNGDPAPLPKGTQPPIFGPYLLWPNGWNDQNATWYEGRPRPGQHCVRRGPSSTPRGIAPKFRPMSVVAKRLDGSRCHLVRR